MSFLAPRLVDACVGFWHRASRLIAITRQSALSPLALLAVQGDTRGN